MPRYTYIVKIRRFMAPKGEGDESDRPPFIPVTLRQMYLEAIEPNNFEPVRIRITRFVRCDEVRYCFSVKKTTPPDPWPRFGAAPPVKWKKDETVDEERCLRLLTHYVGSRAVCALNELITSNPPKKGEEDDDFEY